MTKFKLALLSVLLIVGSTVLGWSPQRDRTVWPPPTLRTRTVWAVPTYTFEIRATEISDPPPSVSVEGSYTRPNGKVEEIEKYTVVLPYDLYMDASFVIDLKISTTEKRFKATLLFEHQDITKWLFSAKGATDIPARFEVKPWEVQQ